MSPCLPVRLAGGSDLADSVAVPAQHGREGPYEGERPDEEEAQHRVLAPQTHIPQGAADHKEALERQHGQGPKGNDPWKRDKTGCWDGCLCHFGLDLCEA